MEQFDFIPQPAVSEQSPFSRRFLVGAVAATAIALTVAGEAAPAEASTVSSRFVQFGHPATKYGNGLHSADDPKDHVLAVSGNFDHWANADGKVSRSSNFVLVDDRNGNLKQSVAVNSYVRRIVFSHGNFYFGGDFTKVDGYARNHLAAVNATSASLNKKWHPSAPGAVHAIAAQGNDVYAGGYFGSIRAYNTVTGKQSWARSLKGGTANVLLADGNSLYAGGSFNGIGNIKRYGLAKLSSPTGHVDTAFKDAGLKHPGGTCSAGPGGKFKDSCNDIVISLATSKFGQLLEIGVGGIRNEILAKNKFTDKAKWGHQVVGDVQAIADIDPDKTASGDTIVIGFHRNSTNNHGHPLATFTAMLSTISGRFKKTVTALNRLSGNGSNKDGGNNGVEGITTVGNRLIINGGFQSPLGIAVVTIEK